MVTGVYRWTAQIDPYMVVGAGMPHASDGLLSLAYDEEREHWTASAMVLVRQEEADDAQPIAGLAFRDNLESATVRRLGVGDMLHLENVIKTGIGYASFGSLPSGRYSCPGSAVEAEDEGRLASLAIRLDTPVTTGHIVLERIDNAPGPVRSTTPQSERRSDEEQALPAHCPWRDRNRRGGLPRLP